MENLRFERLTEGDLEELVSWHADEELSRRYGGNDWPRKLWEIIGKDPTRLCWVAWQGDRRVGYVDFEIHSVEQLAWIGIAIPAALRKQGLGTRILREFLQRPDVQRFREIRAGIEHDNIASIRCFSSVGFQPMSNKPDEEGIVDYSLKMNFKK